MTKKLSGFVQVASLVDNTIDVVSPIGELSSIGRTYSRNKGIVADPTYVGVELTAFTSFDGDTEVAVDRTYALHILEVAKWLVDQAFAGSLNSSTANTLQLLNSNFNGTYSISDVGDMVNSDTTWLPEYVIFTSDADDSGDNLMKFWFSDSAFRAQFDLYTLVVVPPFANLDQLQDTAAVGQAAIATYDVTDMLVRANTASNDYPPTQTLNRSYTWYSKDGTVDERTDWAVLVYGIAGNNEDLIRQAIADYILANSAYDEDAWKQVLPDVFTSTEFILVPMWDRYSIPNQTEKAGVYATTIPLAVIQERIPQFYTAYGLTHANSNVTISGSLYKSLSFLACGSPDNRDGIFKLDDKFPKYALVATTSNDFGRIDPTTQQWILSLYSLIQQAENMTEYSYIEAGYTRVTRDGIPYITFSYDNVTYLMVAKYYFDTLNSGS